MKYVKTLIDKAGENAGSFYKLAAITGLAESTISQIRAGKRNLPLDVVPLVADMAHVEVDEAIHQVMIEQERNPTRRGKLVEILGKAVAAGVVGMSVFSYSGDSISSTLTNRQQLTNVNSLYIVEYLRRLLRALAVSLKRPLNLSA